MTTTITGFADLNFKFQQQASLPFSTTFSGSPNRDFQRQYQATDLGCLYFNNFTVGTSPTTIDLTALTDSFGNAFSFATVKALLIVNNDATNNLTVGGGTDPLFATLPFPLSGQTPTTGANGSCLALVTPLTVSGTTKNLQLEASAGTISVDVYIVGI